MFHILSLDARSFILKRFEMIVSRSNEETLKWLKEIKWSEMTEENLTKEAGSFFGVLKTKRTETVRAKISDYVEKHHNLRQKIKFQIMRAQKGEGSRGRNPSSSFAIAAKTDQVILSPGVVILVP